MEKRVLVVEDDRSLRPVLTRMIEKINPDSCVEWASSAEDAIELIKRDLRRGERDPFDLILTDVWLEGDRTGLDLMNACRQARLKTEIVLTSGRGNFSTSAPYLEKPITFSALEERIGPILAPATRTAETPGKFIEVLFWLLIGWILVAILLLGTGAPTAAMPSADFAYGIAASHSAEAAGLGHQIFDQERLS